MECIASGVEDKKRFQCSLISVWSSRLEVAARFAADAGPVSRTRGFVRSRP